MVNSKTDILEFKRKHNLLVANGTIKANVSNIKTLSNNVINNLRCGDIVLKEDTSGKHAYLVSFKSDTGLCLTYCDASCVETQSYDKVEGNWVYNSEDKWEMTKPIYCHPVEIRNDNANYTFCITMLIFTNNSTRFTLQTFKQWLDTLYAQTEGSVRVMASGGALDKATEKIITTSFLYCGSSTYGLYGLNVATGERVDFEIAKANWDLMFSSASLTDGVNKIN